uniref:Centrosomal protein 97 n=1 Tax=Hucho hucho TaxID=62062 RepID=A0A4W5L5P5_9TELE
MSNPCIMATPSLPGYDYRPYITSWCLNLKILDGYLVSQKEGLKAEWLYSQGKGRSYRPGQHVQLVQYLATVCPLTSTSALETAEDAKLEKILSKQRFHQRQLQQQTQGGSPSPPRPTQLDVETHSPCHVPPLGGAREADRATTPMTAPPARQTEPAILQVNTWLGCEASQAGAPPLCGPRAKEDRLYLEDVQSQTDEDKLTGSLLSSESTFLPVTSDPAHSDSEDETETFEPDSLAPEHPICPKKTSPEKTQHAPLEREREMESEEENREKEVKGERVSADRHLTCTLTSTASPPVTAGDQSQTNDSARLQGAYSNCVAAEVRVGSKQEEEAVVRCDMLGRCETDRAAVRIQAWWRGMWARRSHPLVKEVRCEIRLRRMQEHIIFLSGELERVHQHHEEERLQRLVQEEAVNFLWSQLQSMQQWQRTVEAQLASVAQAGSSPAPALTPGLCGPPALRLPLPVSFSTADPACTDLSFPDSGFQFTGEQQAGQEDTFLSCGTGDSMETVRVLAVGGSLAPGGGGDSQDCSLLEQYLSSVQQREAEEGGASDRTGTPQPPSPLSPAEIEQPDSNTQNTTQSEDPVCVAAL